MLIDTKFNFAGSCTKSELDKAPKSNTGSIFHCVDDGHYYVNVGAEWVQLDTDIFPLKHSSSRYKPISNCPNCGAPLEYKSNEFVLKSLDKIYAPGVYVNRPLSSITCKFCGTTVSLPLEEP